MCDIICILCLKAILKVNEKYRVEGKGDFKVLPELESLPYNVKRTSPFICKVCVNTLKKRRNLIKQVDSISESYRQIHNKPTSASTTSLKRSSDLNLQSTGVKIHRGDHGECSPNVGETCAPPSCSSPSKAGSSSSTVVPQWPVSPIQSQRENSNTTNVTVKVKWPSKEAERTLPTDLESLGKMLLRGTYKQIANAAWRNLQLKKQLQLLMLKEIDRECSGLCSKKNPSCLRSPSKEKMLNFSMEGLNNELKEKAPLTFSMLVATSVNPRSKAKAQKNEINMDSFWSPAVGMAAAICLRARSKFMNALQLLITIFNYYSGWQTTLSRLSALRVTTSHTYLYKKLDEYGKGYRQEIIDAVKNQCQFLGQTNTEPHTEVPSEGQLPVSCDLGRKITIDNFDYRQHVHHMTEDHQNIDVHHVSVMSTENRVGAVEFSDEKTATGILDMENGKCIPSDEDHHLQRKNLVTLVGRIIVGNIPSLEFLADVVTSHIPHKYSSQMARKTNTTFLGLIYENENDADGIINVIKELHQYVPHSENNDGTGDKYGEQGIVGDQLTVERMVNAHVSLANGFTAEERCTGLHAEIADWHSGNRFLQLAFQNLYSPSSGSDKCTMYSDRTLINRRNVKSDVSSAVNPCRQFFVLEVQARVIASALKVLGMESLEGTATECTYSGELSSKADKKNYLQFLAAKIVDEFIIDESKNRRILQCLDNLDLSAQDRQLLQDDENRFKCRYQGCPKTFATYSKWMKDHEAKHDPPILEKVEQSPVVDTTLPVEERDDMLSYQKALLEYGLLILNFWDAISEGDGERIMRCWRFFLMYLRREEQATGKYSLEALYIMCQINALLSPQAAHRLIWNRSVKSKDGPGGNIPLDLQLEFYNRMMKAAVKNLGPNASKTSLDRISHSMGVTNVLMKQFDHELCIYKRSGKHITKSAKGDLLKIVNELLREKALHLTPGRRYKHFKDMKQSLLHGFDLQKLFTWINDHKKNLVLHRRAR